MLLLLLFVAIFVVYSHHSPDRKMVANDGGTGEHYERIYVRNICYVAMLRPTGFNVTTYCCRFVRHVCSLEISKL